MDWESLTEICFGLLIKGQIAADCVRPDMFVPPYDKAVEFYKDGNNSPEVMISKLGISAYNTALEAVSEIKNQLDWVALLNLAKLKAQLADSLDKASRQLRKGEDIEYAKIAEKFNLLEGELIDGVPMSEVVEEVDPFLPTGWAAFDNHIIGVPKAGLVTIGGLAKVGKTSFVIKLLHSFLLTYPEKKACVFTLEMMASEFKNRATGLEKFITGTQKRVILFDVTMGVEEVANKASKYAKDVGIIVVDFADLMIEGDTDESAMGHIYRVLAKLAKRLNVPVILLSQLSRSYNGGIPKPRHLRWCLPQDAKIIDADTGRYFSPVDVLYEKAEGHHVWSFDGKKLVPQIFTCQPAGKQSILKITLASGFELRCSDNHPLLVGQDWKEAKQLKVGDTVAVAKEMQPSNPVSYSPEKARILGYMLGDGYMPTRGTGETCWVEPDDTVVADFDACLQKEFPTMITRKKWHTGAWKVSIVQNKRSPLVNEFSLWLEDLGIRGVKSVVRYVPKDCFSWDNEAIKSLLIGLFVSDGSVSHHGVVTYASYSLQMLIDVKHLLTRFGIIGSISGDKLTIANYDSIRRFQKCIGFIGKKSTKLDNTVKKDVRNMTRARSEILPFEVSQLARSKGLVKPSKNRCLTKYKALKIFPTDPEIAWYANDSIWWDKIKSIKPDGFEETYDLSVPEYHNFVVNDILTHNTGMAEALSWMILMLYNPNTDWNSPNADSGLPPRDGSAYCVVWAVRGGIRKHESQPGAIQLKFDGKTGWGDFAEGWIKLNTF